MFPRNDHVAFTVEDLEKSLVFYERHFGFQKYFEHGVPNPAIKKIAYLRLRDTVLELVHMPGGPTNSGYHFCLINDDFDGDYRRLCEAGIEVEREPHDTEARVPGEKGWRRAVFRGPDGESIEMRG